MQHILKGLGTMRPILSAFKRGGLTGASALAIGLSVLIPSQAVAHGAPSPVAQISVLPPPGQIDPRAPAFNDPCVNSVRVTTPAELNATLQSTFTGCVIIPRNASFDMSRFPGMPLRSGVSLIGERGDLGSRPTLFSDPKLEKYALFDLIGNDVRVAGLHLRGPAKGSRSSAQPYTYAIRVAVDPDAKLGRRVLITENEFDEWTGSGVDVPAVEARHVRLPSQYLDTWARLTRADAGLVRIERNYFHH